MSKIKKIGIFNLLEEEVCELPGDCGWHITVGGYTKKQLTDVKGFLKGYIPPDGITQIGTERDLEEEQKFFQEDGDSFPVKKSYTSIEVDVSNLSGKILTVIDGAITDSRQNKAVKDQIKSIVRDLLYRYQHECSDGNAGHSIRLEDELNKH